MRWDIRSGQFWAKESSYAISSFRHLRLLSKLKTLRHTAYLNFAVHKGWERQKIGTLLITRLIEWARSSESIEKIQLYVRSSNLPAIALYKKMGFHQEGLLKDRVKVSNGYVDDIIMALHLT